jgi:rSAM/selenodomain-associated transferase 2
MPAGHPGLAPILANDGAAEARPGPALSIIIPVLDEAAAIGATLARLAPLRARGVEAIVVDGGSRDDTVALARAEADAVVDAPRGRARQLNAGAAVARGHVLLFLHADTWLPADADRIVLGAIAADAQWGRFDVRITGRHPMLRVVATAMNLRSRLTGIATGDQAIFVRRAVFEALGGFPDQPLMEDIELSARLRRSARPVCLLAQVQTSGRRWETRGVWRTILLMWRLRWRYWRGEPARSLAEDYR